MERDTKPRHKLSLAQKGVRVLQTLAFSAAASFIPPSPDTVLAQSGAETSLSQLPPDPTTLFISVYTSEASVLDTKIGLTTDEEVNRMHSLKSLDIQRVVEPFRARALAELSKEDLGDGFTRYSFPTDPPDRRNMIITQGGVAIFKRQGALGNASQDQIEAIYGIPEAITRLPEWYMEDARKMGIGIPLEELPDYTKTWVYASQGVAFVMNKAIPPYPGHAMEAQVFIPTTVEEYISKWGQGDYNG